MKSEMKKIGMVLALALLLGGCKEDKASTAPQVKEQDVIANVSGKPVTGSAFDAYIKHKRIPKEDGQQVKRELDRYLAREGLAAIIEQQGVLDAERIAVEVNEFRKQMLISRYFEAFLNDRVTDEAIRNYYTSNPERFQSRKAHVAHVLIRTNPKMSDQERNALLTKAQEVYSRAMAKEDFEQLAQDYSQDNLSGKKGGDLGWLQEGAIDPAFSKVVFEMKTDEISQPIATPFGFHVVKILEQAQIVKQPYEKVKGDIRFQLRQQAKEAEMERLRAAVKIEKKG